jgi:hypothetical protein
MEFDFSKLLGRIVEMFGTRTAFAEKWGKTDRYLSDRLNNKIVMDMVDIHEMRELLDIAYEDIPVYFFTVKVR